jgi:hypothetical protein
LEVRLHEAENFNVSSRARMDALELQVTNLGAFQAGVRTTFDEVDRRISRHRRELKALTQEDEEMQRKFDVNTGVLCDSLSAVEAKIESMVDKLCHCSVPSPLSGQGTSDSPYELEYADEDAPSVVPLENKTPLPVAGPSSVAPQDSEAENVPPVRRDALRLIEGVEEGDGYVGMSERALDELRVLCEGDAEDAMSETHHDRMMKLQAEDSEAPEAGPSTDPVERYIGVVRDSHRQVARRGRRSDPTRGFRKRPGSHKEHKLRDRAFFERQRRDRG